MEMIFTNPRKLTGTEKLPKHLTITSAIYTVRGSNSFVKVNAIRKYIGRFSPYVNFIKNLKNKKWNEVIKWRNKKQTVYMHKVGWAHT